MAIEILLASSLNLPTEVSNFSKKIVKQQQLTIFSQIWPALVWRVILTAFSSNHENTNCEYKDLVLLTYHDHHFKQNFPQQFDECLLAITWSFDGLFFVTFWNDIFFLTLEPNQCITWKKSKKVDISISVIFVYILGGQVELMLVDTNSL